MSDDSAKKNLRDIINKLQTGKKSGKTSLPPFKTLTGAAQAALSHRLKDRVVAHVRMQRINGPYGSIVVDLDEFKRYMQKLDKDFALYDGSDNPYVDALLAAWQSPAKPLKRSNRGNTLDP